MTYEIGYKKPPRASQFKKGVCSNPLGRGARKKPNVVMAMRDFLLEEVKFVENGRPRKSSRVEAGLLSLRQRALQGDVVACDMLLKLYEQSIKLKELEPQVIKVTNALPSFRQRMKLAEARTARNADKKAERNV